MLNRRQQLQQQQLIYGGGNILPLRGIRAELLRQYHNNNNADNNNHHNSNNSHPRTKQQQLHNIVNRETALLPSTTPPKKHGGGGGGVGNQNQPYSHSGGSDSNSKTTAWTQQQQQQQKNYGTKILVSSQQQKTPPEGYLKGDNYQNSGGAGGGSGGSGGPIKVVVGKDGGPIKVVGKDGGPIKVVVGKDGTVRVRRQRPPAVVPPIHFGERHVPKNCVTLDTSKARGSTEVLRLVARDLGWREVAVPRRDHNCDVFWHAISFHDQSDIFSGQVNKFPGATDVFHKVSLFRQLMLLKTLFPEEYDFFPRTWVLPAQFHEFCNDVRQLTEKKLKPKPTFIVKPSEGSQGEGIYLLRDPQSYAHHATRTHVAQDYLCNVLLIDGFKFDLRVYVVVKTLDPLEIHICNEGLARFSTLPYENPTQKNLHETFMHLTNYSLNKKSTTFKHSEKEDEGSKRKMTAVFRRMERMGLDTTALWRDIEGIVCKTLTAVAGELKVEYQAALPPGKPNPSCFQVLGFDILIMKDLKAVLLEVNSNPSLSIVAEQEVAPGVVEYCPSGKDEDVKRALIRDTLILMAPKNKHTRKRRKPRQRPSRRQQQQQQEGEEGVELMEVDSTPSPVVAETKHRNHHRERDVTIRFQGDQGQGDRQRSIFAESDKARPAYQRQETCRVFVEGEGEVTNFETPPYYQHNESEQNSKDVRFLDGADRQRATIFQRNKLGGPAEAFMEDDGPISRPLPFDQTGGGDSSEDDDDDEDECCLKEIFPGLYGSRFSHIRVTERLADVFITCLSVRGCLRMGPTAFRMFARKCRLNSKGMNNASIDILYIDMQRKWEFLNPDRTSGLCFQGFVDACMEIARRKFASIAGGAEMLEKLIAYCENSFKVKAGSRGGGGGGSEDEDSGGGAGGDLMKPITAAATAAARERLSPRILRPRRKPTTLFPGRTVNSLEEETVKDIFHTAMLKRGRLPAGSAATHDVNNFMRDMRHKAYVPSVLTGLTPREGDEGDRGIYARLYDSDEFE